MVHIFVETSIYTEAAPFVEPVEVNVFLLLEVVVHSFLILLRHFDHDAACFEQEDLFNLIASLDNELSSFVSLGAQEVNYLLNDVIVEVSEVWNVLYHPLAEVEIHILVFGDVVSEFLINNREVIFCLLERFLVQRRQRAIFI